MGRLDRLELHNFKSYGGDVVIGPFMGFTAVIGTNGSGKSNVMDAISFVLGVRTTQLRGNQLRDLVYRNLEDPNDDASGRKASVKLVYQQRTGEQDSEIHFMRSVTLTGSSEYSYQGRVISQQAYNSKLASIGVLVKARNFLVFQNEVESIASKSPKELASMFEEVSESAEFRVQYEQARQEKDEAEEAVTHFWRKRKGMAAEKKQYKEQKEEAERYKRLQNEVGSLKTEMALFELFHVDEDLRVKTAEKIDLSDELKEKQDQLHSRESVLETERTRIQKLGEEKVKLERKKKRFRDEIEKLLPLQVKIDTEKSGLVRRIKGDERTLEKLKDEQSKGEDEVQALENELSSVRKEIAAAEREIKEAEEANVSAESMNRYRVLKEQLETRTSMVQQELDVARRNLNGVQSLKDSLEQREQDLRARVTQAARKASDYRARANELSGRLQQSSETIEQLKHDRVQLAEAGQERENIRRNLENKINDVSQALRDAKADMTQSSREENFNKALDRMMNLFPGVHGRLSDLCQPTQDRYREAIAVIFGKMMDAIIVDNSNTGRQCIEYLKDQRVGVGTFIPLSEIRGRPIDESLRRLGGTSRLAIDVLKHRDFITNAVLYVTANAVVCDTLDEARYIRYEGGQKIKICTLDGTLINKAGFMTGGKARADVDRGARKWDRAQIEKLKKERQHAIDELEKLGASEADRRSASDVMERIEAMNREIAMIENDYRDFQARAVAEDRDGQQSAREVEHLVPQITAAKEAYTTAKDKMDLVDERLRGVENEIFGDFIREHNVQSVQQFESLFIGKADKIRERKLELETKESKINTTLKFQKSQGANMSVVKLEKRIEARRDRLEDLENEAKDVAVKKSELESRSEEVDKDIERVISSREEANEQISEKKQDFRKVTEGVTEASKLLEEKSAKVEELLALRKRLLTAAKVGQIHIPLLEEGSDGDSSRSMYRNSSGSGRRRVSDVGSRGRIDQDGDIEMVSDTFSTDGHGSAAQTQGTNDDEGDVDVRVDVVINYAMLSRRHRASATVDKQKEMIDAFAEKIKETEKQLDGLAPNMKAKEHMSDVAEKLNEIDREADSARDRARRAVSSFENIRQKRQDRFNACFNHVAGKINDVYKELTKSETYPMGGTAYLSLEQQDEPYLSGIKFNTMPPTKRFRDMDQLSGGERTVAALALLFAIHDFRPSPFFVLDEVDAALDKLNVGRVCRYIRSRSSDLQTIVISLKDSFFEHAQGLVGVYRDAMVKSSRILTLDLTKYPEEGGHQQTQPTQST